MSQEIQVPSTFQNRSPSKVFQGRVDPYEDNLADGIGQSYPIIAYKGKIWALRYRGERKIVTRKDDGTPSGHLDVVILLAAKNKSKSFYKKYDPSTSEGERPICASMDGIVPDLDVAAKQSDTCAICPRNVWKTNPESGRRERECTDYKRLAVLVMPYQTEPLFGKPLMEPMFLRVPPDSLNSLAIMGDVMSNQGHHYSTYLTRITFDPQKAHPSMLFRPVQPLEDSEAEVIVRLIDDPVVSRIVTGEVTAQGPREIQQVTAPVTMERQQQAAAPASPTPLGLGSVVQDAVDKTAPKKRGRPAKAAEPAQPAQPVSLGLTAAPAPSLAPQTNGQNATVNNDTGDVEPSDDELDAEIAKLISK